MAALRAKRQPLISKAPQYSSHGGRGDEVGGRGRGGAAGVRGISSRNRSTESWPWVEKYRPSSLDDLIAHQEIISTLNRLIDAQKLPHLLFYGPRARARRP